MFYAFLYTVLFMHCIMHCIMVMHCIMHWNWDLISITALSGFDAACGGVGAGLGLGFGRGWGSARKSPTARRGSLILVHGKFQTPVVAYSHNHWKALPHPYPSPIPHISLSLSFTLYFYDALWLHYDYQPLIIKTKYLTNNTFMKNFMILWLKNSFYFLHYTWVYYTQLYS